MRMDLLTNDTQIGVAVWGAGFVALSDGGEEAPDRRGWKRPTYPTQRNSHRRPRAAGDGPGLPPAGRVAAAGDCSPPGNPRRPFFRADCHARAVPLVFRP